MINSALASRRMAFQGRQKYNIGFPGKASRIWAFSLSAGCGLLLCLVTESSLGDDDSSPKTVEQQLASIQLTDVSGVIHKPFANTATKAVALIFVSTDCPIANSFQPVLQDLFVQYQQKGIPCFMVYCLPELSVDAVNQHRADFEIKMPGVVDSDQKIGRLTKAKVTPEAIVINRQGEICYRGLINNLYAGYGKKRPQATVHYLQDAFDSLVAGTSIATKETMPLGCFIRYAAPANPSDLKAVK